MTRRLAFVLFGLVCFDVVWAMPAVSTREIRLRLNVAAPLELKYKVHRVWKATPKGTGNGNQIHDLVVGLTSGRPGTAPLGGRVRFDLTILSFSGQDLAGGETKHLKEIATAVQGEKISRGFNSQGPVGVWVMRTWNNAGWAGMMAEKSIGLYEIGFLDAVLPDKPVHVGSRWTHDVPFGDEGVYADGKFRSDIHDVKGNVAHCTFELKDIDMRGKTATVSFSGTATTTFRFDSPFDKSKHRERTVEKQSGRWVLSLTSGLPQSFHAVRRSTHFYSKQTEVEEATTDVVRAS